MTCLTTLCGHGLCGLLRRCPFKDYRSYFPDGDKRISARLPGQNPSLIAVRDNVTVLDPERWDTANNTQLKTSMLTGVNDNVAPGDPHCTMLGRST